MASLLHLCSIGLWLLLIFITCMDLVIIEVEIHNGSGISLFTKSTGSYVPSDQVSDQKQDQSVDPKIRIIVKPSDAEISSSNNIEDELLKHNLNLIRSRPSNTTIVFVGDSVMRYQYLSLAYFFKFGRWYDPKQSTNATNFLYWKSFEHPLLMDDGWNEYFAHSNLMLYPMEICDCYRNDNMTLERRYFYDKERNNKLVFINLNGKKGTVTGSTELIGRIPFVNTKGDEQQQNKRKENDELSIFDNFDYYLNQVHFLSPRNAEFRPVNGFNISQIQWRHNTWGQVIQHHVSTFLPKQPRLNNSQSHLSQQSTRTFTAIVLNAGRHPHDFKNSTVQKELAKSVNKTIASKAQSKLSSNNESVTMAFWRTTSVNRDELVELHNKQKRARRKEDYKMCELLGGCLDLLWAQEIPSMEYYADNPHYTEPIYRIMNEDLLEQMQALPHGYVKLDKQSVMKYNLTTYPAETTKTAETANTAETTNTVKVYKKKSEFLRGALAS